LDSSSDNGNNDDNYDDDDTNTHALHQHFQSKCGGCKFSFPFDGDEGDGDSGDDDDDDDDLSKATLSSLASSGDSSSSACSSIHGNDPNWASYTSNPFQPSSNQNAFGRSDDTDVMLLSRTNNSLQQRISSSDSSSLIGLRCNLECNARAKANSYKVGNDSSEVGHDCFSSSSNESASVDAGNPSIPMPNSFKPSPRSSFEVSNVLLSKGHAMTTGPVVNLHLGSPERGDVSRRGSTAKCIGTRSSTMAVKALQLLQPAKGENEGYGNGSGHFAKHKKALRQGTVINTVVTNSLVISLEITECLNKSEWKQIKSLLGRTQPALYYTWGEDYNDNLKKAGQLDPPRMLDLERVKSCGLKKMYLVACNCDASLYNFTDSLVWLHGRLWYFQLPQIYTLAKSLDVLDQIVVVGAGDSFEDDVVITLNGQSLMSLSSFHKIDFEGARDHMDGGKTDRRRNNINLTYGYSKQRCISAGTE
jgi:hypothetical protein